MHLLAPRKGRHQTLLVNKSFDVKSPDWCSSSLNTWLQTLPGMTRNSTSRDRPRPTWRERACAGSRAETVHGFLYLNYNTSSMWLIGSCIHRNCSQLAQHFSTLFYTVSWTKKPKARRTQQIHRIGLVLFAWRSHTIEKVKLCRSIPCQLHHLCQVRLPGVKLNAVILLRETVCIRSPCKKQYIDR